MRSCHVILLAVVCGFGSGPAWAADAKTAVKSGGHFEVDVIKDIPYYTGDDADAAKHKLDLYLPKGHKDFPVLFFVHGGTWQRGDKSRYVKLGDRFARNGIGTVIISYRLTPAVKHPEHVKDVARAFAWTHRNIAARGGRADQIFACGHSAGGHLVALLACDETYLKGENLALSNIKGVIPMSGVYTVIGGGRLSAVFGSDKEICRKASPIEHVTGNEPPFLILYAEKDYLTLDLMAENMCRKLKSAKTDAAIMKLKDRDHISIIRNTVNQDDPATQAILEFIAKHSGLTLTAEEAKP
jgi:acetyl esterase/lipase